MCDLNVLFQHDQKPFAQLLYAPIFPFHSWHLHFHRLFQLNVMFLLFIISCFIFYSRARNRTKARERRSSGLALFFLCIEGVLLACTKYDKFLCRQTMLDGWPKGRCGRFWRRAVSLARDHVQFGVYRLIKKALFLSPGPQEVGIWPFKCVLHSM